MAAASSSPHIPSSGISASEREELIVGPTIENLTDKLVQLLEQEKALRLDDFQKRQTSSMEAIAEQEKTLRAAQPAAASSDSRLVSSSSPTVSLPHSLPHPIRVIIAAVDASECSQQAVDWARKQGYILPSDLVILLTVWEEQLEVQMAEHQGRMGGIYSGLLGLRHDAIRQHNDDALRTACAMTKNFYQLYLSDCDVFPFIVSSRTLALSSIGSIICQTAEKVKADCIVVGSRGYGTLKRFFVGSVSKYVVNHAKTPVLLVKR